MKWCWLILLAFLALSEARQSLRQLRQFCYRTENDWEVMFGAKYKRNDWFRWCKARGYLKPSRNTRPRHRYHDEKADVPPGMPPQDIFLEDRRMGNEEMKGPSGNINFNPIHDDDKPIDGFGPDIAKPVTLSDENTTMPGDIGSTSMSAELQDGERATGISTLPTILSSEGITDLTSTEPSGQPQNREEVPTESPSETSATPGPRVTRSTQLSPPHESKRSAHKKNKKKQKKLKKKSKDDFPHKSSLKGKSKKGKRNGSTRKVSSTPKITPALVTPSSSIKSTPSPDEDLNSSLETSTGSTASNAVPKCPKATSPNPKKRKIKHKKRAGNGKDRTATQKPSENRQSAKHGKKSSHGKTKNIKPKKQGKQNRLKFHDTPKDKLKQGKEKRGGKTRKDAPKKVHLSEKVQKPNGSQTKTHRGGKNKKPTGKKGLQKEKSAKKVKSNHGSTSVTVKKGGKTIACSYTGVKSIRKMKAMCKKSIS